MIFILYNFFLIEISAKREKLSFCFCLPHCCNDDLRSQIYTYFSVLQRFFNNVYEYRLFLFYCTLFADRSVSLTFRAAAQLVYGCRGGDFCSRVIVCRISSVPPGAPWPGMTTASDGYLSSSVCIVPGHSSNDASSVLPSDSASRSFTIHPAKRMFSAGNQTTILSRACAPPG